MDELEIVGGFERQLTDKECTIIRKMMIEENGIREIFGNTLRLFGMDYQGLIKYNNEYIGFFLLVRERINNIYFVDRAIKEQYRNLGIGTLIMKYIVENYPYDDYLISETRENNKAAISSALKVGKLILEKDELRYYLLNKSEQEFRDSGMYDKFIEYENKPKLKSYEMMRKIMNER